MRPQSEIRIIISAALIDGGGTTRHLAQRTNGSIRQTMTALDNMVRAGDAAKTRNVRVPGVCRPVPWYERACRDAGPADGDEPLQDLILAWALRPLSQATANEAVM